MKMNTDEAFVTASAENKSVVTDPSKGVLETVVSKLNCFVFRLCSSLSNSLYNLFISYLDNRDSQPLTYFKVQSLGLSSLYSI